MDYVLGCRCQVVGNSEFVGGVMLSTILLLVDDNFYLGSVSRAVKCHGKDRADVAINATSRTALTTRAGSRARTP